MNQILRKSKVFTETEAKRYSGDTLYLSRKVPESYEKALSEKYTLKYNIEYGF